MLCAASFISSVEMSTLGFCPRVNFGTSDLDVALIIVNHLNSAAVCDQLLPLVLWKLSLSCYNV